MASLQLLADLAVLIHAAPAELRAATNDRDSIDREFDAVRLLKVVLAAMCSPEGPISDIFAHGPDTPRRTRGVRRDLTDTDADLQGTALLACWSMGFAAANAHHMLADAGLK